MSTIKNPILRGFNPDPSIVRAGEDYYIAVSTFEWFPGVRIYHSKDLVNWRYVTSPLNRKSLLDMEGNINSGGVWAPCLSYDNGTFYLVYTDVKSRKGAFKDTHNYLTTAENIEGPWSEPIYLNSSGFDPSLFHDDDGRKWLVNMLWDHRKGRNSFAGTVLQEYSVEEKRLIGERKLISPGTHLGLNEAPHLYKYHGYYYLMTAEGGTQYEHAVTVARSKNIEGPYEIDPLNPMLTSAGNPELTLQKAGHASLVETHTGEFYLAHLCGRPVKDRFCVLGRETALQKVVWSDDLWLRLEDGGNFPYDEVKAPAIELHPWEEEPETDHFDDKELGGQWSTLRIPPDPSWLSLEERPGYLRLKGQESMSSTHRQSLVARRQDAFCFEAETAIEFEPEHFQQMAGLILYYDTDDYEYLRISHTEGLGKGLNIIRSVGGQYDEVLNRDIPLPEGKILLKAVVNREWLQFYYDADGTGWKKIGTKYDISHLSDEASDYIRFTGNFVGVCVQDLAGTRKHADFDYFTYRVTEE